MAPIVDSTSEPPDATTPTTTMVTISSHHPHPHSNAAPTTSIACSVVNSLFSRVLQRLTVFARGECCCMTSQTVILIPICSVSRSHDHSHNHSPSPSHSHKPKPSKNPHSHIRVTSPGVPEIVQTSIDLAETSHLVTVERRGGMALIATGLVGMRLLLLCGMGLGRGPSSLGRKSGTGVLGLNLGSKERRPGNSHRLALAPGIPRQRKRRAAIGTPSQTPSMHSPICVSGKTGSTHLNFIPFVIHSHHYDPSWPCTLEKLILYHEQLSNLMSAF